MGKHEWIISIDGGHKKYQMKVMATDRHSITSMFAYIRFWLKITSPVRNFMCFARNKYNCWGWAYDPQGSEVSMVDRLYRVFLMICMLYALAIKDQNFILFFGFMYIGSVLEKEK